MTGTYTTNTENSVVMVDVVQSEKGTLTGRIEAIDAKPDGALADTGANLTGVRDGRAVSLSISGNSILSDSKQVSATLDGDKLTMTAPGDAGPLVLLKSDMATFLKDATALRARASNLAQQSRSRELQAAQDRAMQNARLAEVERAADQQRAVQDEKLAEAQRAAVQQRRLLNDITNLTAAIDAMQPRAARIAKRAENVSSGYDRATGEMARLLTRQTSLANQDRYSSLRGQITAAISQQALQTDRVHSEVESGSRDVTGTLDRIERGLTEVLARCGAEAAAPGANLSNECQALGQKAPQHRAVATRLRSQLDALEQKYRSISERQSEIQRSSDAVS